MIDIILQIYAIFHKKHTASNPSPSGFADFTTIFAYFETIPQHFIVNTKQKCQKNGSPAKNLY
jgi:hypothetical protein